MVSVHLRFAQPQNEISCAAVAGHAFIPAGKAPRLFAAARFSRNSNLKLSIFSFCWNKLRIGLPFVPSIRIANPLPILFGQQSRLNSFARSWILPLEFQ